MRELNICLFLAIPAAYQNRRILEPVIARSKRRLKQARDLLRWHILRSNTFDYHAWHDVKDTNKGDAAIRQATRDLLTATFPETVVNFTELAWDDFDETRAEQIGRENDLFVIAGSGYFHLDSNGEMAARVFRDAQLLARMTCSKIALGIGINRSVANGVNGLRDIPTISSNAKSVMRRVLDQLSVISVRDPRTKAILSPLTEHTIFLGGDAALYFAPPSQSAKQRAWSKPRIGLNIGVHEADLVRRLPQTLPAYLDFLHHMQREHGAELHYVQHTRVERVIVKMLRARGLRLTAHDLDFNELPGLYAGFDFHVCEMLHSSILSLAAGTPTINVAYDSKNIAFYKLMGLDSWILPAAGLTADAMLAIAGEILGDRAAASDRVLSRISALKQTNATFLHEVRQIVLQPAAVAL